MAKLVLIGYESPARAKSMSRNDTTSPLKRDKRKRVPARQFTPSTGSSRAKRHLMSAQLLNAKTTTSTPITEPAELPDVIECVCDTPKEDKGHMICCDFCDIWFHKKCMGLLVADNPDDWWCPRCTKKDEDIGEIKLELKTKITQKHKDNQGCGLRSLPQRGGPPPAAQPFVDILMFQKFLWFTPKKRHITYWKHAQESYVDF